MNNLFRKKTIQPQIADNIHAPHSMKKVLRVRDLTMMGIAAVIGAGIFSTIGTAAYNGGPGVILLFVITAVACGLTALCYAEFASRVPVSGSAYTYSYVTFGELIAWIIGWSLILEYSIGNIVVAISWSAYFSNLLEAFHLYLPEYLRVGYQTAYNSYLHAVENNLPTDLLTWSNAPTLLGVPFIINLPAFIIVVFVTLIAYIGISESKTGANIMVLLKIAILIFIAVLGFWIIFSENKTDNWSPFLPNGMKGVFQGVSAVFFAYIGFDAISTTAEECENPQRDLPRGMIYSLLICTIIYVIITLVITGLVNYSELEGVADPLAYVFNVIGMSQVGLFISAIAVVASTSVLLVFQVGQPRIWMSMSRDGLLPSIFGKLNKKSKVPGFATIITGLLVGLPALFIDELLMTDLTSIGTLFAFILVCGGVLMLPVLPEKKGFKLPYINGKWIVMSIMLLLLILFRDRIRIIIVNFEHISAQEILFILFLLIGISLAVITFLKRLTLIPVLGILSCLYLMVEIPANSWFVFLSWMVLGLIMYFLYSRKHSVIYLQTKNGK